MFTGILLVNLILNSAIVDGQEACIVTTQVFDTQTLDTDSDTLNPVINSCKELVIPIVEMTKRDYSGAAIAVTINGVSLNSI